MNGLEITEAKAAKLNELEDASIDLLLGYLKGDRQGGEDVITARVMMSVVKGNRQTETVKQSLKFSMAQAVADEKQLKKYVAATSPEIKKLLGK